MTGDRRDTVSVCGSERLSWYPVTDDKLRETNYRQGAGGTRPGAAVDRGQPRTATGQKARSRGGDGWEGRGCGHVRLLSPGQTLPEEIKLGENISNIY